MKDSRQHRIGSVPYLNARPLIQGIQEKAVLKVPSELSRDLRNGLLDAALVPVAEYLEHPHYLIAPGISIASRGVTQSVYLAHRADLASLKTVFLDPSSKTSNLLLQVIFREFLGLQPEFKIPGSPVKAAEAFLLIGDPALSRLPSLKQEGYQILDLGQAWNEKAGLPFVFAFWAIHPDADIPPLVALLQKAKQDGLAALEEIIGSEKAFSPGITREYLTRNIHYDLGKDEIRGLEEFQRLCVKHQLIPTTAKLEFAVC